MKTFIVQCGGFGTRMGRLTSVKPKALIPIDGKPLIFHLMDNNPNSKFIIITDYCSEILFKYIKKYRPNQDIKFVTSTVKSTCAGIPESLKYVDGSFFIIWSDLYVKSEIKDPITETISVGVTTSENSFPCRWSVKNGKLEKTPSEVNGVSGLFYVKDKMMLNDMDETKSFTSFLSNKFSKVATFSIENIDDVGDIDRFYLLHKNNRFFNKLTFTEKTVIKEAIVENYKPLISDEINWYTHLSSMGFSRIPNLIEKNPFTIERLNGKNPFNCTPTLEFMTDVVNTLKSIHAMETRDVDIDEIKLVYLNKTLERVYEVSDLIPFFEKEQITINGKKCINPFHPKHIEEFKHTIEKIYHVDNFTLIHGDCTFSNMISVNDKCYLIDPRGYFGKKKLYGDPRYDWAKLYYSFIGNYDNINSKNYSIAITDEVRFDIDTNGWEKFEEEFFKLIPYNRYEIKLIHVLIWFSLCGYVKEDYSSVLLSYYNAVYRYNLLKEGN